MSIVGTRPPLISETNLYEPHHKVRLAIKPGITGMWQVSGRSDITDFEEVEKGYTAFSLLQKAYWTSCAKFIQSVWFSKTVLCLMRFQELKIKQDRNLSLLLMNGMF